MPILDAEDRVFSVVVSAPAALGLRAQGVDCASDKLHEAVGPCKPHRRGDFDSCHFGFSHGQGRQVSDCLQTAAQRAC